MSITTDVRGTILGIVNEVERKLSYTPSPSLSARNTTINIVSWLNDTLSEISDYADWPQMYSEVIVSAQACVNNVEINASAPFKRIYEVHFSDQIAPLYVIDTQDMRVLERTSAFGEPRQLALTQTSGVNPIMRVYPTPGSAQTSGRFNVASYLMPRVYVTGDATETPEFSSRLLVQGTFARALLDENGGEPTQQYQIAYGTYQRLLREEANRMTVDTGTDLYLTVVD